MQNDMIYPGAVEGEDYYIPRPCDTLEGIADMFLGGAELAPLLAQLNGLRDGKAIPGVPILLHPEGLEPEIEAESGLENV